MKYISLIIICLFATVSLQAQVSKTVNLSAGGLSLALTAAEKSTITNLTVTGTIDARDFKTMRDDMQMLAELDLSGVTISGYSGTGGTDFYRSTYSEKAIPSNAFWGKKSLTSILLPLSVTSIQRRAFSSCTGLTSISIPSSVNYIEYLAFSDCTYLITVDITNPNYSSLEGVLFNKSKSILIQCPITKSGSYIIPSSVTTIEKEAFSYCIGLTSVTISQSVTSIMSGAFHTCESLNSVTIPSSVTSIQEGAFAYCAGLSTVTIPSSITSIAKGLFMFCTGLKSVIIPSSVDSIGVTAFYGCTGLSTINIPLSVKIIGIEAFKGCVGLTSLSIPSSVNTISSGAFNGCTGLTSLSIPSSVTTIGSEAFNGCPGLISITLTGVVPLDISSGYNIFGMNKNLCTLNVPFGSKNAYQTASQWQDFRNIVEATTGFIISSRIASVAATAGSKTTIDITSNVNWTAISNQSWLNVSPSSGTGNNSITLISVEENIASTNRKATVTISASGVDSQTISVTQAESDTPLNITSGGLKNLFTADELRIITKLTLSGTMDSRDFKTMRDNMPLLSIVDLSKVTITEFTGTEGTSGTSNTTYPANIFPDYSFKNPNVFNNNILTEVSLPSSVISIGYSAFRDCTHLNSINIPSSITTIGKYSFTNCFSLIYVDENNPNYSSIDGVLYNKDKTSLIQCPTSKTGNFIIPSSVNYIGILAFENCSRLTSLSIPSSVKSIDADAFSGSNHIISIYSYSPSPPFLISGGSVFAHVNGPQCTLYVPIGSWLVYYKTMNWGNFAHIVEFDAKTTAINPIYSEVISLYPNPITDGFQINGLKETSTLSVSDINGRSLLTKEIESNEYISVSALPQGVYIVKITSKSGTFETKLVKR